MFDMGYEMGTFAVVYEELVEMDAQGDVPPEMAEFHTMYTAGFKDFVSFTEYLTIGIVFESDADLLYSMAFITAGSDKISLAYDWLGKWNRGEDPGPMVMPEPINKPALGLFTPEPAKPLNTPVPTEPPPTSTPIPLSRDDDLGVQKQVGSWGMNLYAVKRAKAIYYRNDAEVAQGVWLLPFVEFSNLGTGTRSPWEDLDFYLFDDRGWSYEARHNDAWLEAGWQFQAGDIMDDINPGLMLGVVLPVDVPEDMGDVWLRVEQDPGFAMYLGNASSIPLE